MDVFAHISCFHGPTPENFHGLPGMPLGLKAPSVGKGWRSQLLGLGSFLRKNMSCIYIKHIYIYT